MDQQQIDQTAEAQAENQERKSPNWDRVYEQVHFKDGKPATKLQISVEEGYLKDGKYPQAGSVIVTIVKDDKIVAFKQSLEEAAAFSLSYKTATKELMLKHAIALRDASHKFREARNQE